MSQSDISDLTVSNTVVLNVTEGIGGKEYYSKLSEDHHCSPNENLSESDFHIHKYKWHLPAFFVAYPILPLHLLDDDRMDYLECVIKNNKYLELKGFIYSTIYQESSIHHLKMLFEVYELLNVKPLFGTLMFHYALTTKSALSTSGVIIDFLLTQYTESRIDMVLPNDEHKQLITQSHKLIQLNNSFICAEHFQSDKIEYFINQCNNHNIIIPNFYLGSMNESGIDYNYWITLYEKSNSRYKIFFTMKQIRNICWNLDILMKLLTVMIENDDKTLIPSLSIGTENQIMADLNCSFNIGEASFSYKDICKFSEFVRRT